MRAIVQLEHSHLALDFRLLNLFLDILPLLLQLIRCDQMVQSSQLPFLPFINRYRLQRCLLQLLLLRMEQTTFYEWLVQLLPHSLHISQQSASCLPLLVRLDNSDMLAKLESTRTGPSTPEFASWTQAAGALPIFAFPGDGIVVLEGMFAEALKVISPVSGYVEELLAGAFGCFARYLFGGQLGMVVFLRPVVAEALGLRANHFTICSFAVSPRNVQPAFGFFDVFLHPLRLLLARLDIGF